jgi:hypothetical protein
MMFDITACNPNDNAFVVMFRGKLGLYGTRTRSLVISALIVSKDHIQVLDHIHLWLCSRSFVNVDIRVGTLGIKQYNDSQLSSH